MINKNISEVINRININREIDSDLLSEGFYNILQLENQSKILKEGSCYV